MSTKKMYTPVINPHTGQPEITMDAILVGISDNIRHTKTNNPKTGVPTPYQIATVAITYPDESVDEVQASIWSNSLTMHSDMFKVGSKVGYVVNIGEGQYQMYGKVELPALKRAEMSKLSEFIDFSALEGVEIEAKEVAEPINEAD